ncbi:MAG TPA: nuclear transport factor 2 family protein [Rhizomicrobium sp.]|nr:nuclear transport factor 2 family protein [Rhizomicrobium sp.]
MTKDEAEIRAIIADRSKALYAKNAELLFAHNAKDFFSYDLDPPLLHKGTAPDAKAHTEAWFATWKGPISREDRDVSVTAGGDVAFATSLAHMSGTKTEGYDVSLWFRTTTGFRKENSEWKIVHSHSSVPFAMDGSFKACVDLKP